ncbi:MAG: hypothetical protein EAZ53_10185 [Bacteroidetes bacterium]|nr:MAG: hypothetical protein EAZ53_10185 [Bacteroidota bacterium]
METFIIKTKTKLQAKTIKAVSEAMGSKIENIEDLLDQGLAKMMDEGEKDYLSSEEQKLFMQQLKKGEVGKV